MPFKMTPQQVTTIWCVVADSFKCDKPFTTKEAIQMVMKELNYKHRTAEQYVGYALKDVASQDPKLTNNQIQIRKIRPGIWVLPSYPEDWESFEDGQPSPEEEAMNFPGGSVQGYYI